MEKFKWTFAALGICCMLGAGYMLYPREPAGVKLVSKEETAGAAPGEMEKPVSTGGKAINVQALRNPFSPEHELRENMPEILAMEKGRSFGNKGGSESGAMGAGRSEAGGGGVPSKVGNGTVSGGLGSSGKTDGESARPQLTGILIGDQENLAIFSQNGKNFSLAAGESQEGLSLISIEGDTALVDWNGQNLQLSLT